MEKGNLGDRKGFLEHTKEKKPPNIKISMRTLIIGFAINMNFHPVVATLQRWDVITKLTPHLKSMNIQLHCLMWLVLVAKLLQ